MDLPIVAEKKPTVLELEAGVYYWCACGRSGNQPFCDGSHQGSTIDPKPFTLEEKKRVALCNCKQTGNPPFCDGAHSKL